MSPTFAPEPSIPRDQTLQTAILLCNLGTPDAPSARAVRRYLAQFLSDTRVVELPRLLWQPLLHGVILRTRPRRSAAKYAAIWDAQRGSPLQWWTAAQARLLQEWLHQGGRKVLVRHAMRYGNPSIASQLDALRAAGAGRILILPLYPQYSCTTTASVGDAVYDWARCQRHVPELRFVNNYHDEAAYIDVLARSVREHWQQHGRGQRLVISFHGVPHRTCLLGDPYHAQSLHTAHLLAQRLELVPGQYLASFQSRFGRARWLQPYTKPALVHMAGQGIRHVDVICPGFAADCLETLEEINHDARQAFMHAGGTHFGMIACLNDRADWIAALGHIAMRHMAGWPGRDESVAVLPIHVNKNTPAGAHAPVVAHNYKFG